MKFLGSRNVSKKLLLGGLILMMGLFLISFVNAWEFDNVKSYDPATRTVTIKNALGLGDDIGKAKLITPLNVRVSVGYEKVAEFELTSYKDYEDVLKSIDFYNMNEKDWQNTKFSQTYDIKYKTYKDIEVDDFENVCVDDLTTPKDEKNNTIPQICEYKKVGSHIENKTIWTKKITTNLKKNEIVTVGIFTEVQIGDYVEWIPKIYGVEVDEWATWTADLNVDLIGYWKFDDDLTEEISSYSLTAQGATTYAIGKINKSLDLESSNSEYADRAGGDLSGNLPMSINAWVKMESDTGTTQDIIIKGADALGRLTYGIEIDADNKAVARSTTTGNSQVLTIGTTILSTGTWYMLTFVANETDLKIYVNGSSEGTPQALTTMKTPSERLTIGKNSAFAEFYVDGLIDEIGMWEKALSQSEITQLYNSGTGMTYTTIFPSPNITLNSPVSTNYTTTQSLIINFTAWDDINLTSVKLYVNDVLNQTNSSGINNTNYLFDLNLGDGEYTIYGKATDSNSLETNSSSIQINIDTTPDIQFESPTPVNNYNSTVSYIPINISLTETYFKNITFDIGNGTTYFFTDNTRFMNDSTFADGTWYYNVTVWTTTGKSNSTEIRTINIDTINPVISSNMSDVTLDYNEVGSNESIYYSINDTNIDTCYYDYSGTNVSLNCTGTELNITLISGNTNITFYANDTFGRETFLDVDWDYKLLKDSEVYTTPTLEGDTSLFRINIITNGSSITIANLSYNGTGYLGSISNSGNNYTIIKNMNIPSVNTDINVSFYWMITTSEGNTKSIDSKNQTIYNFDINETCGAGMYSIYNFTLADEITQAVLNGVTEDSSIIINLDLYNSNRNNLILNYSHDYSQINPASVCISNNLSSGASYSVDIQIQYSGTNYSIEYYNIKRYILNSSTINQEITLYDLATTDTQNFKLIARDSSYLPLDEALIQIDRKYLENGTYYTTEIPLTDYNGITSASLQTESVIYTFYIYDSDGDLVYAFENVRAICQTPLVSECEIDFNAFQTGLTLPDSDDSDFEFTLGYNDTSRTITSTFSIPSGVPEEILLRIINQDTLSTSVCSDTITSSSGTLSCLVPSSFGNSTVRAIIYRNSIEQGRGSIKLDQKPKDIFGVILVFLSLLIAMTLIGMGISDNPVITGVFLFVGVLLLSALNLIQNNGFIGATSSILFLAIAIILVIIKAGRRT